MAQWTVSPVAQASLSPDALALTSLSVSIKRALLLVVDLAGGWITRPAARRRAYDSGPVRKSRRALELLLHLQHAICGDGGGTVGHWPRLWLKLLGDLERLGFCLSQQNLGSLREIFGCIIYYRQRLAAIFQRMRHERHLRWRETLPCLWRDRPGVIQHWLRAKGLPWGSLPILDSMGLQCLSVTEVDHAVRSY